MKSYCRKISGSFKHVSRDDNKDYKWGKYNDLPDTTDVLYIKHYEEANIDCNTPLTEYIEMLQEFLENGDHHIINIESEYDSYDESASSDATITWYSRETETEYKQRVEKLMKQKATNLERKHELEAAQKEKDMKLLAELGQKYGSTSVNGEFL